MSVTRGGRRKSSASRRSSQSSIQTTMFNFEESLDAPLIDDAKNDKKKRKRTEGDLTHESSSSLDQDIQTSHKTEDFINTDVVVLPSSEEKAATSSSQNKPPMTDDDAIAFLLSNFEDLNMGDDAKTNRQTIGAPVIPTNVNDRHMFDNPSISHSSVNDLGFEELCPNKELTFVKRRATITSAPRLSADSQLSSTSTTLSSLSLATLDPFAFDSAPPIIVSPLGISDHSRSTSPRRSSMPLSPLPTLPNFGLHYPSVSHSLQQNPPVQSDTSRSNNVGRRNSST